MRYFLTFLLLSISSVLQAQPSIDSMSVDEVRHQLLIYGNFASDQGSVTIDGAPQEIIRWTPVWVRCSLPDSGTGSSGPVVVLSREGTPSAPRTLTEYKLKFKTTWTKASGTIGSIDHTELREWDVRIRCDLESRMNSQSPGAVSFQATSNSDMLWRMYHSLSMRSSGASEEFSARIPAVDSSTALGATCYGTFDLKAGLLLLHCRTRTKTEARRVSLTITGQFNNEYHYSYDTTTLDINSKFDVVLQLGSGYEIEPLTASGRARGMVGYGYNVGGLSYEVDSTLSVTQLWVSHPPKARPRSAVAFLPDRAQASIYIDQRMIHLPEAYSGRIAIFNSEGRLVGSANVTNAMQVDISMLTSGWYHMRLVDADDSRPLNFEIER